MYKSEHQRNKRPTVSLLDYWSQTKWSEVTPLRVQVHNKKDKTTCHYLRTRGWRTPTSCLDSASVSFFFVCFVFFVFSKYTLLTWTECYSARWTTAQDAWLEAVCSAYTQADIESREQSFRQSEHNELSNDSAATVLFTIVCNGQYNHNDNAATL